MVYVTGDLHFGDDTVRKLNRSQNKDVFSMNKEIVERWNKKVSSSDEVWLLGDLSKTKDFAKLATKLNGRKFIILGNHDLDLFDLKKESKSEIVDFYQSCGFEKVYFNSVFYNENIVLSHEPQPLNNEFFLNVHAHLHNAHLALKNYYNVAWDASFCNLIEMERFIKLSEQCKKIRKKFGKEWYFENYRFI